MQILSWVIIVENAKDSLTVGFHNESRYRGFQSEYSNSF